ncbi:nucleotide-binding protein [Streptomyces sp. NBC_00028]|uniref:TIR domain-containing protein n=1 Tax=Streptomyces sp. NBC_00028 TaxID=2975624 RepID=UPI00324DCA58
MHFHVLIEMRGAARPEVELDLDEEGLESRFVRPRKRGKAVVINGRVVENEDLVRIRIGRSDQKSAEILEEIQLENAVRQTPVFDRSRLYRQVVERSVDVTNSFLRTAPPAPDRRTVLLISGEWGAAARAMGEFLRALGLDVRGRSHARLSGREGQHHADVLDSAFDACHAVVVLMTPDDVATRHPAFAGVEDAEVQLATQASPSVLFQAGYAWHAARERTLLVEFGSDLRYPRDLSGVDRVCFDGSPASRNEVAQRLRAIRSAVRTEDPFYLEAGAFPSAPGPVTGDDLGPSPAAELLRRIPLRWVLLGALAEGKGVDVSAIAARRGTPPEEVRAGLSRLMTDGLAAPMEKHSKSQAANNGACRLTGPGLDQLHSEMWRPQGR